MKNWLNVVWSFFKPNCWRYKLACTSKLRSMQINIYWQVLGDVLIQSKNKYATRINLKISFRKYDVGKYDIGKNARLKIVGPKKVLKKEDAVYIGGLTDFRMQSKPAVVPKFLN